MGSRDAKIWYEISRTLYLDHDRDPLQLFSEHDFDMGQIGEYVQSATGDGEFFGSKFPYLKGDEIRPLWMRNIHWEVRPLAGEDGLDIPVDVQIQKVTNNICGTSYDLSEDDKQQMRDFWWDACEHTGLTPADLDSPLWRIGKHWDEWGKPYIRRELEERGLSLPDERFGPKNNVQ